MLILFGPKLHLYVGEQAQRDDPKDKHGSHERIVFVRQEGDCSIRSDPEVPWI